MPARPKYVTGSSLPLIPWCVTVSTRTRCPDFTRSTGARSAAIQPQLTVSGVERSTASAFTATSVRGRWFRMIGGRLGLTRDGIDLVVGFHGFHSATRGRWVFRRARSRSAARRRRNPSSSASPAIASGGRGSSPRAARKAIPARAASVREASSFRASRIAASRAETKHPARAPCRPPCAGRGTASVCVCT